MKDTHCTYCYTVYDAATGRVYGGGKEVGRHAEQVIARAANRWQRDLPNLEVHIEEIPLEEYDRALGRNPGDEDWGPIHI